MPKYIGRETLEVLEGADNYNDWIASSIKYYIQSPALEIGSGTGNISSYFKNLQEIDITDSDPNLVKKLKEKFRNNNNINIKLLDISRSVRSIKKRFKTIYSVNVLEHIENDLKALQNMNYLLERNGRAVLLVPAKKFAYNKLDKNLGHYRRYEKEELKKKLEMAKFNIEYLEYFNILGLLSWIVREKVSRNNNNLKPYQVKIFDLLVPALRRIEPKRGLPYGISLIAVGKKYEK